MLGHPIEPGQGEGLREIFLHANKRAWCYFSPFLCAFSLKPNRVVHVADILGSTCLLVERPDGMDLLFPPIPYNDRVIEKLADFNRGRLPRILWVDADDGDRLRDCDLFLLKSKDSEYIYDPSCIAAAVGKPFRDLRKRVRRFERAFRPRFRPMNEHDVLDCQALLKHWRRRQGRRHPFLLDWGYTRAALDQFHVWSEEMLQGWCVEIDGQVDAFAMVGQMQPELAQFFIAKADPDLPDLSYFLRWQVYGKLSSYCKVNDAGDLGLPGMRQFKQKFRPVERWPVFSAEPK